jgi:hypothetical protein
LSRERTCANIETISKNWLFLNEVDLDDEVLLCRLDHGKDCNCCYDYPVRISLELKNQYIKERYDLADILIKNAKEKREDRFRDYLGRRIIELGEHKWIKENHLSSYHPMRGLKKTV